MTVLRALLACGRLLRSLPTLAYAGAGVVAVAGLLWAWHGHAVAVAYAAGHRDTVAAAHFDAALLAAADRTRAAAVARTDTVVRTVIRTARRVDSVIVRVPDSVRVAYPVVDTLVIASAQLTYAVDSLHGAFDVERTTTTLALSVRDAQVTQARFVAFALADSLRGARHRPRWRTVAGVALVATAGGFVWGTR